MGNEDNFALVVVGAVAIVAIIGLLNLSGFTGKLAGSSNVIQTSAEKELYLTQWECEDNGKYNCDSFLVETTVSGASSYRFWQCGEKLCHNLFYRTS